MTSEENQIAKFFENQTIFIAGGTGFLGKLLVEKLLRSCWSLKKIYVLVRPKKNKTPQQRFEAMFENPCFDLVKTMRTNLCEKVVVIGATSKDNILGLNPEDFQLLKKETTCLLHLAASVNLDQNLKEATDIIRITEEILNLAKQAENLKALVYVSTAYSNSVHSHIKEEVYKPPIKGKTLLDLVDSTDDETLKSLSPWLLGRWPNSYAYAKCVTEGLIRDADLKVPTAIVRPVIISNTMTEPVEGWTDNSYGFMGLALGMNLGVLRSLHGDVKKNLNLVPADFVRDCILASTWKTAKDKSTTVTVYNCCGEKISIGEASTIVQSLYWAFASEKYLWYKSITVTNKFWHNLWICWYSLLAYIADGAFACLGKPQIAVKTMKYVTKRSDVLSYYTTHEWTFQEDNVAKLWNAMSDEDRKVFNFREKIVWCEYLRRCCLGMRLYLLKDPMDTLPRGQRKVKILLILHHSISVLTYCVVCGFGFAMLNRFL